MAGGLVYAETNRLLESSLNGKPYDLQTPSWVALTTVKASATDPGTEVATPRQQCAFRTTNNVAQNSGAVNFTAMPNVQVVGINVWDAATAGNRKWWADLSTPRQTAAGDTISFADSNISFTIA